MMKTVDQFNKHAHMAHSFDFDSRGMLDYEIITGNNADRAAEDAGDLVAMLDKLAEK
jgi:hypothetical protein